jgi:hypothetical protein
VLPKGQGPIRPSPCCHAWHVRQKRGALGEREPVTTRTAPSGSGTGRPSPVTGSWTQQGQGHSYWVVRGRSARREQSSATSLPLGLSTGSFFSSLNSPKISLLKKKISYPIKIPAHIWSTECRWNQKLITQFGCTLRDELMFGQLLLNKNKIATVLHSNSGRPKSSI